MRKLFRWLCGLCLLNIFSVQAQDATVRFSTSNERPLVGEPVQIELFVTLPADAELASWPEFPLQWDSFEVQTISDVAISQINGDSLYRQTLTVILWKPGTFSTPETRIDYQLTDESSQRQLFVEPMIFIVPSVLADGDVTLRPLKSQIELPFLPPQIIVIAVCLLSSVLWWMLGQWRARQRQQSTQNRRRIRSIDEALLAALQQIDQQVLEPAIVFALASDLLRDYMRDQFRVAAHELTTRELLRMLQNHLSPPMHQRLQQLLGQADLVKFARQQPDHDAARQYLEAAARWIQSCARDLAQRQEAA